MFQANLHDIEEEIYCTCLFDTAMSSKHLLKVRLNFSSRNLHFLLHILVAGVQTFSKH